MTRRVEASTKGAWTGFVRTTTAVWALGIKTYGSRERRKSWPRRATVRLVWKVGRWLEKCSRGVRTTTALCTREWARQGAADLGLARSVRFALMDAEALTSQSRGQWHGVTATHLVGSPTPRR
jgi:hypothetical protein